MPIDEPHQSAAHLPEHVAAPIGADEAGQALKDGRKARSSSRASRSVCSSSAGYSFIFYSSCRESHWLSNLQIRCSLAPERP